MRGTALAICLAVFPALPVLSEARAPQDAAEITLSFAPVVRETAPAVVNIYASRVVAERVGPFANDPFFREFFGDPGQTVPRVQNSLGSGVILSPDGIVVSNFHVVGESTEIRVVLNDRREYSAEVILADEASDLAVLRLDGARDLPALDFRDSDTLEVGDLVLAIGNPFGIGQTVSSGIVSGLARSSAAVFDGRGYFIQTDAAINPGNSGGALVDMAGRLVGINTAILTRTGGSMGVGFAIPSNLVAQVVAQAEAGSRRFVRPWAGIGAQAVDAALSAALGAAPPQGIVLTELHPESPFRAAGLRAGDMILEIAGAEVNTPQEMLFRLSSIGVGKKAEVLVRRSGSGALDRVQTALSPPPESPPRAPVQIRANVALRGLSAETINPAVIADYGLPLSASGVLVTAVTDLAARIGLRAGDILTRVNGNPVADTSALERAAGENTRNWALEYIRDGRQASLRFRL
jgi:Do/DeqQ family serine protease